MPKKNNCGFTPTPIPTSRDCVSSDKPERGLTLIETLIYLGLFGIIIGSIGVTAYAVIESIGRSQTRIVMQQEGGFLLGKFNWALADAQNITVVPTSPSLSINKYSYVFNPVLFNLNGAKLRIKEGSAGTATDLNSDAVQVAGLTFTDIPAAGGKPEGVAVKFTLRGTTDKGTTIDQDFETTKYLR